MPPITLWFLQASRSIRIAWLLEELGLDYEIRFADRMRTCFITLPVPRPTIPDGADMDDTANMKAPNDFKASSGNPLGKFPSLKDGDITVYLCSTYDAQHKFIPSSTTERIKVLQWLHAAEATFLLHALAITYVRWNIPSSAAEQGVLEQMEAGLAVNVQKDLDWLETELSFRVQEKEACKETDSYKRAVEKSGYSLTAKRPEV
ncbi:hypothetical protein PSPO01_13821 [Paraphaeosphaeria sporulosa]